MLLILFVGGLILGACIIELVHCWIYKTALLVEMIKINVKKIMRIEYKIVSKKNTNFCNKLKNKLYNII